YPFIKRELEKKGYSVSVPALPNPDKADLKDWLPFALKLQYTNESIMIGHSAGCPLILSILENIDVKVKQAILVAAYFEKLKEDPPILQEQYDWEKIKSHVEDFIVINSDNDPWGCDVNQGLKLIQHVGGK